VEHFDKVTQVVEIGRDSPEWPIDGIAQPSGENLLGSWRRSAPIVDALLSEGQDEVAVRLELIDELNEGWDDLLKLHARCMDPARFASGPIPFRGTGLRPLRSLLKELGDPLLNVPSARPFPATDVLSTLEVFGRDGRQERLSQQPLHLRCPILRMVVDVTERTFPPPEQAKGFIDE
jgi:hypothetical protein